jgi:hypothetical protein
VSDDWRDGRWHPDYPDAECFYHGVICWRDGHEERLATEDIPYELNRLDTRVAELEDENARLREALEVIARANGDHPTRAWLIGFAAFSLGRQPSPAHFITYEAERELLQ